jgi:hypothetical protein
MYIILSKFFKISANNWKVTRKVTLKLTNNGQADCSLWRKQQQHELPSSVATFHLVPRTEKIWNKINSSCYSTRDHTHFLALWHVTVSKKDKLLVAGLARQKKNFNSLVAFRKFSNIWKSLADLLAGIRNTYFLNLTPTRKDSMNQWALMFCFEMAVKPYRFSNKTTTMPVQQARTRNIISTKPHFMYERIPMEIHIRPHGDWA